MIRLPSLSLAQHAIIRPATVHAKASVGAPQAPLRPSAVSRIAGATTVVVEAVDDQLCGPTIVVTSDGVNWIVYAVALDYPSGSDAASELDNGPTDGA